MNDLLKPRYEVIADYPFNNHFKIKEVIILDEFDSREHLAKEQQEYFKYQMTLDSKLHVKHTTAFYESTLNKYPHLFRPLSWWEHREEKEMPKWVKHKLGGYYEVFKWYKNSVGAWRCDVKIAWFFIGDIIPITETEYHQYINQKTNQP